MSILDRIHPHRWTRLAFLAGPFVSVVCCLLQASAQPGAAGETTVRGTVQRPTTAKKGEVDGVLLEDGTWVHWPPHLESRFKALVKPGDRIRATGRHEVGKKGDRKFEITSLTNLTTNQTAETEDGTSSAGTQTVRGTVQRPTTAKKGEVDGVLLEDGTWVHWPPHLESRFKNVSQRGERIRATGRFETDPKGNRKFEVESLTKLATNETAYIAEQGPTAERQQRLRQLEREMEQIRAEIDRLRAGK